MNEDEVRRFSYITSNLKGFNNSGFQPGTPMDRQIQKIIAGDFDNDSVFEEAERTHRNGSIIGG